MKAFLIDAHVIVTISSDSGRPQAHHFNGIVELHDHNSIGPYLRKHFNVDNVLPNIKVEIIYNNIQPLT